MGDVVDINDRKPHTAGPAVCLVCKHEWPAVVIAGEQFFECPSCHTWKGVFMAPAIRSGHKVWTCIKCDGTYFEIYDDGATQCIQCGYIDKNPLPLC